MFVFIYFLLKNIFFKQNINMKNRVVHIWCIFGALQRCEPECPLGIRIANRRLNCIWRAMHGVLRAFLHSGPNSIRKACRFSYKVDHILRLCRTLGNCRLHNVLEFPKKLNKIPYEFCRLWILLEHFSEKILKSIKKH